MCRYYACDARESRGDSIPWTTTTTRTTTTHFAEIQQQTFFVLYSVKTNPLSDCGVKERKRGRRKQITCIGLSVCWYRPTEAVAAAATIVATSAANSGGHVYVANVGGHLELTNRRDLLLRKRCRCRLRHHYRH